MSGDNEHGRLMRVMTALQTELWLLPPAMHRTLCDIAAAHAAGGEAEARQHMAAAGMSAPAAREYVMYGDVAVIPVEGVIGRKFSSSLHSSGVTSIDVLDRLVSSAAGDPRVSALVLSIDSPGGLARGVPEAAKTIAATNLSKPVVAYIDGQACSAAYWLASQCAAIYSTESGSAGSVGVYSAILDVSGAYAAAGVRVDMFKSGVFKGMGQPGTSLTTEQRELIQRSVDTLAAQFKATVRAGRARDIEDDVLEGQSFDAEEAIENGLVDSITTFETAIADASRLARIRHGSA